MILKKLFVLCADSAKLEEEVAQFLCTGYDFKVNTLLLT